LCEISEDERNVGVSIRDLVDDENSLSILTKEE
jgi:hypothetical protein